MVIDCDGGAASGEKFPGGQTLLWRMIFSGQYFIYCCAFTGLPSSPIPSTPQVTTSPSRTQSAPAGVPVRITSPGMRVMNVLM